MSYFNGRKLKIEIFGESHSKEIGVKCKGFPKFSVDKDKLCQFLNRRKATKSAFSTPRIEKDAPEFIGKVNNGKFKAIIKNQNVKSGDYKELYGIPRPSHADYASYLKDGTLDFTGGGRFSARLTAPLCIAGGIAKQYLESLGIKVCAYLKSVGNIQGKSYKTESVSVAEIEENTEAGKFPALSNQQLMLEEIERAKESGDSIGGVIECIVFNMKKGIGDNLFSGLEGKISSLVYAIPAVKGVEFGKGFDISKELGSNANDNLKIIDGKVRTVTNNSGGINGGISNGEQITLSVAFRPTPSISKEQDSVDLVNNKNVKINVKGRHDSCVAVRAVPCVESAVAIALLDEIL